MADKKAGTYKADTYIIQKGDSVYGVARKLSIPYDRLLEANPGLENPKAVAIGQQLSLPLQGIHTMQKGDTFFNMAKRYNLELTDLQRVNPEITDMNHIDLNTQVRIPYPLKAMQTAAPLNTLERTYNSSANPSITPPRSEPEARRPSPRSKSSTLQPASGDTLSYNIPKDAVKNAWSVVTGQKVNPTFQQAAHDPRPLIVIDPGHGAYSRGGLLDRGFVAKDNLAEVDVVDPVAIALAERLAEKGYRIAFTRNPGEIYRFGEADAHGGRLASRAHFAHALESQINAPYTMFVSIHANTSENASAHGTEIQIDNATSGRDGRPTSKHSEALARCVLDRIDGYGGLHNRGIKTYNACVLDTMEKKANASGRPDAAILIELGFLSNEKDKKVLSDVRSDATALAEGIAQGIHDHACARNPSFPAQLAVITPDFK